MNHILLKLITITLLTTSVALAQSTESAPGSNNIPTSGNATTGTTTGPSLQQDAQKELTNGAIITEPRMKRNKGLKTPVNKTKEEERPVEGTVNPDASGSMNNTNSPSGNQSY